MKIHSHPDFDVGKVLVQFSLFICSIFSENLVERKYKEKFFFDHMTLIKVKFMPVKNK